MRISQILVKIIILWSHFAYKSFPKTGSSLSHSSHIEFLRFTWNCEIKAKAVAGILQIFAFTLVLFGPGKIVSLLACCIPASSGIQLLRTGVISVIFQSSLFLSLHCPSQLLSSDCRLPLNVSSRRAGASLAFVRCVIPSACKCVLHIVSALWTFTKWMNGCVSETLKSAPSVSRGSKLVLHWCFSCLYLGQSLAPTRCMCLLNE